MIMTVECARVVLRSGVLAHVVINVRHNKQTTKCLLPGVDCIQILRMFNVHCLYTARYSVFCSFFPHNILKDTQYVICFS